MASKPQSKSSMLKHRSTPRGNSPHPSLKPCFAPQENEPKVNKSEAETHHLVGEIASGTTGDAHSKIMFSAYIKVPKEREALASII